MNCPKCDFKMGETDLDCPRCEKYAAVATVTAEPEKCRKCGKVLREKALRCSVCGLTTPLFDESKKPKTATTTNTQSEPMSGVSVLGGLLLVGGLAGLFYYMSIFQTSVAVPGSEILGDAFKSGRVNNIGLIADRQNGMIGSGVAAVIGTLMLLAGGRK